MPPKSILSVVEKIIRQHSLYKPPVLVDEIAQTEGLELLLMEMDADMSGALLRSDDDDTIIVAVNEQHSRVRQRFTIAHELGHHFLGHLSDHPHIDREFTIIRRDELSSQAIDDREIAANAFAANLLMPEDWLIKDFVRMGGFQPEQLAELALRYQVSEQSLRYRLANLGLLPPF